MTSILFKCVRRDGTLPPTPNGAEGGKAPNYRMQRTRERESARANRRQRAAAPCVVASAFRVIGVQALKDAKEWSKDDIFKALSEEALTASVMQRYHVNHAIKRELGSKLGRLQAV